MEGLSDALSSLGRLDEAEEMTRRVLRTTQELQGKEHASTQKAVVRLAGLLLDQGKQEEAKIVLRQTASLYQTSDASQSQNLEGFECLTDLADILRRLGNYQEAEEMSLLALNEVESLLGAKHSTTLRAASVYALALYKMGKLEPAEIMIKRALNGDEQLHGYEHLHTLRDLLCLSTIQMAQGEFKFAEETGLQALKAFEKTLGVEHYQTIYCKDTLARIYWAQRRDQEAISLLTDTLKGYEKVYHEGHPDIAKLKNRVELWQREVGRRRSPLSLKGETSEASAEEEEADGEQWKDQSTEPMANCWGRGEELTRRISLP